MTFRSKGTLDAWLDEFKGLDYPMADGLRVIEQDLEDADDGLVGVRLRGALTGTYIQPIEPGSPHWAITFEARDEAVTLDSAAVTRLATELTTVSALCAFLEAKSHEADLA